MERRKFILNTAGTLATLSLARSAWANDGETPINDPQLSLTNQIGRNHGHAFEINLEGLILLMREANATGEAIIDIQGTSGHPHSLSLNIDEITTLLVEGSIQKNSSVDFGHDHPVLMELKETV